MKFLFSLLIIVSFSSSLFAKDITLVVYPSMIQKALDFYFPLQIDNESHPGVIPFEGEWKIVFKKPKTKIKSGGIGAQSEVIIQLGESQQVIPVTGAFYPELSENGQQLVIRMEETKIPLEIQMGDYLLKIGSFPLDQFVPPIELPLMWKVKNPNKQTKIIKTIPKFEWFKNKIKVHLNVVVK